VSGLKGVGVAGGEAAGAAGGGAGGGFDSSAESSFKAFVSPDAWASLEVR